MNVHGLSNSTGRGFGTCPPIRSTDGKERNDKGNKSITEVKQMKILGFKTT